MCELCRKDPCVKGCPNYIEKPLKSSHVCVLCENQIQIGEEYIKNEDNDYIHYDCIEGDKWLVNWLGFEVKEMEENDD